MDSFISYFAKPVVQIPLRDPSRSLREQILEAPQQRKNKEIKNAESRADIFVEKLLASDRTNIEEEALRNAREKMEINGTDWVPVVKTEVYFPASGLGYDQDYFICKKLAEALNFDAGGHGGYVKSHMGCQMMIYKPPNEKVD